MLAQIELNPTREQALMLLEQETGENRHDLLLAMFDFYVAHHSKQALRPVPQLSPETQALFTQIASASEFSDVNLIYQRYGIQS